MQSPFGSRATFHHCPARAARELGDEAGLLVVLFQGTGMLVSGDIHRILAPGDTALLSPGTKATFIASSRGSGALLIGVCLRGLLRMQADPFDRGIPSGDPSIAESIRVMRSELQRHWTVAELARKLGMSRAAFARRFKEATQEPPLRHLTGLRLARAAELLEHSELGLAELAEHVGYRSEFAFSRAFKRRYGVAPGTFRRGIRRAPTMFAAAA